MIEATTTFLWQTPSYVDTKVHCASVPVPSTNNIHADMGASMPVSAFFVSGKHIRPLASAQSERSGSMCFPQNCQ